MNLNQELQQQLAALGLAVDVAAEEQLVWLLREMLRWNKTHNLTAITDPHEGVEKHLVDSLTLLTFLKPDMHLLDIGSGAGFPSLPLNIVRPELSVVSVDSVAKKINFQKHAVRKLKLEQYVAWHGRAESLPAQVFVGSGFDLVVARAFSSIRNLVELALPCLASGGRIVAMKGPEGRTELEMADDWLKSVSIACHEQVELTLPASGARRQLLVLGR